ncbi:hypothetical protein FACS189419_06980 [Planctomycetales bacterium]|nr:hypothetical protein FACS189419_06980 [Planctomycetales bacterium]
MNTKEFDNIPNNMKEYLLKIAKKLPTVQQSADFIRDVTPKIINFVNTEFQTHPRTVVYGALAYLLSVGVIEAGKNVPVIGIVIDWMVPDAAEWLAEMIIALAGAGYGFMRDREINQFRRIVSDAFIQTQRKGRVNE